LQITGGINISNQRMGIDPLSISYDEGMDNTGRLLARALN
jgi:hypothetical protein